MTIDAHVKDGRLVLPEPLNLPDGTCVRIELLSTGGLLVATDQPRSLHERMREVIGIDHGLPSDASQNIDHHLSGQPKQ